MYDIDAYKKRMTEFRRDLTYRCVMRLTKDVDWWEMRERECRSDYNRTSGRLQECHRKALREARRFKKKYRYELACESEKLARMVFGETYM